MCRSRLCRLLGALSPTHNKANGLVGWLDGIIFRASASGPATIRIDLVG